jgi:adenylate cyclase class IV
MIEARALIESIAKARERAEKLGAEYVGEYAFKDIIFCKNDEFLDYYRIRAYSRTNRDTKMVVLTLKKSRKGEKPEVAVSKEFDEVRDALAEISPEYRRRFEFVRNGWEYNLKGARVFIEDIEKIGPTIEVESENIEMIDLLEAIGYREILKHSVPKHFSLL